MKIKLTNVYVNDPIEAHKFYTEKLGFKSHMVMPEMNLAIVVSAEEPQGTLLLLEPSDNPIAKRYQTEIYEAGFPAIVFSVGDIHAEYERLKGEGVVFRYAPKSSDAGLETLFEDSCGNLIQVYQD